MSRLLEDIVSELAKLPSIGRRTSMRLALHLLKMDSQTVEDIAGAMTRFRNEICYCSCCNNLSDTELCPICSDESRDRSTICVVEQVGDLLSVESTNHYKGLYHVLGGVISPLQGIAPSDLKVDQLVERVAKGDVKEVIMAISSSVEGETTQFYIMSKLRQFEGVKVSNIARGIGFGEELEYVDELTIGHALRNRTMVYDK